MTLREPWRTRLLFLSFAVNLVTLSMIGARSFVHRPAIPGGPPRPQVMIDHMADRLPPGDAPHFREVMARHAPDIEVARAQMQVARAQMSRAIGHDPFDEAQVREAMKTWQRAWSAWSGEFDEALVAGLETMSPEGRRALAEAGRRRPPPP